MENHFEKRLDPRKLFPGAKSVVSLLYNYFTDERQVDGAPKVSKYAFGKDYHFVIKDRLKELVRLLEENVGKVEGRVFVDSAPVLERAWAQRSGLGWIGKNTNLINRKQGSFLFLAEFISDLELVPDGPIGDFCGTCTRCIDACPTSAIVEPYLVSGMRSRKRSAEKWTTGFLAATFARMYVRGIVFRFSTRIKTST
jgi:epoxyqueuosine reductase